MVQNLFLGLRSLLDVGPITAILLGVIIGLIIGALPGLTGNMAMALVIPFSYSMEPTTALALLAAIYCSSIFGGSISAILLGIPGTISSICTVIDGHPMALRGRAGEALGIATLSSVFGGLFSAIVLIFMAQWLAEQALLFGPAEYFAVAFLGLTCIAGIGGGNIIKNLLAGMVGLLISAIGFDPQVGYLRYTFGNMYLLEGLPLIPILIGLFGVTSLLKMAYKSSSSGSSQEMPKVDSVWIGIKKCRELLATWLRSSVVGTIIGIIPGTGTNVATFLAYDMEKKISKDPESFGHGNPIGVAAAETANNAVTGGSLVPLLALGVPGNSASALFLSALMIHGMSCGPELFMKTPDIAYSLLVALLIVNIIMAPLGLMVLRIMKRVLAIPENIMAGIIAAFCVTGVFATRGHVFDIVVMIVAGILGFLFYLFNISTAPLIVALVLGSLAEKSLKQALVIYNGSYSFFFTRPITLAVMLLGILSLCWPLISKGIKNVKSRRLVKTGNGKQK